MDVGDDMHEPAQRIGATHRGSTALKLGDGSLDRRNGASAGAVTTGVVSARGHGDVDVVPGTRGRIAQGVCPGGDAGVGEWLVADQLANEPSRGGSEPSVGDRSDDLVS
jgi:hypothetical protein